MTDDHQAPLPDSKVINIGGFMSHTMFATVEAFVLIFVILFVCFDVIPILIEKMNSKK